MLNLKNGLIIQMYVVGGVVINLIQYQSVYQLDIMTILKNFK